MAGLLSKAWGAVDPIIPDERIMGLLRQFGGGQSQNQPITPGIQQMLGLPVDQAPQAAAAPSGGGKWSNGLNLLSAFLRDVGAGTGGASIDAYTKDREARAAAQREAEERARLIGQIGMDPREQLGYRTDGKSWAENSNKNYAPQEVTAGNTMQRPGRPDYTAPVLRADGGVYGTQGPDGYTETGKRSLGAYEAVQQVLKEMEERRQRAEFEEAKRKNRAGEDIARSGVGVRWAAHNARLKGVGGYGTPGVGGAPLGASLGDEWEIQP